VRRHRGIGNHGIFVEEELQERDVQKAVTKKRAMTFTATSTSFVFASNAASVRLAWAIDKPAPVGSLGIPPLRNAHRQGRRSVSADAAGAGCTPHSGAVWSR